MLAGLFHNAVVAAMPLVPRPLIWQFSQRYIAGTHLEDAYQQVRELNAAGCTGTIDVLGEDSTEESQVRSAVDLYLKAIEEIHLESLDCGVSVKLSEMGLRYDIDRCKQAMTTILSAARDADLFVRIDMEDSSVTDVTLAIYRELRQHFDNVGVVIQSCLHRSADDVADLIGEGPTDFRLCKGIYIEPEEISWRDADEIRNSFNQLLDQIFADPRTRVGIATHDPELIDYAVDAVMRHGIDKDRYEFQMLLGVAGPLRRRLVTDGHPMRVYVPFGELWYNYSMRRLRENPHIAGHIIKNLFRRR